VWQRVSGDRHLGHTAADGTDGDHLCRAGDHRVDYDQHHRHHIHVVFERLLAVIVSIVRHWQFVVRLFGRRHVGRGHGGRRNLRRRNYRRRRHCGRRERPDRRRGHAERRNLVG